MTDKKEQYLKIRDKFSKKLAPKALKTELCAWEFYINSTEKNLKKFTASEDAVQKLFKDEKIYKELCNLRKYGLEDKHLNKQLQDLIKNFDEELNTGDLLKELRDKENEIAAKYNAYIPMIDGQETTKAEIYKIVENEKDVEIRQKAYEAKVKGGDIIANDLIELVKLRNAFALTKGYENYFDYMLKEEYDVDAEYLEKLLDDVYCNAQTLNNELQTKNKNELSQVFNITPDELKAYHYGFILDDNPIKDVNLALKEKEQVIEIAKQAYKNMGFDIDNMPITLDLFPRKNKNTHGFCFEIEAGKDSRILANLTNNTNSIDTLCHELGHCVYNLGIDINLPYLDKETTPAMTEAIAMMMGDLQKRENILKDIVSEDVLKRLKQEHKKSEARFINSSMQIINFEREMYKNPNQDMSQLWHDMKCKYSFRNKNEDIDNEWATIPHYLSHPAYYQNYFRANIIKAQIYRFLTKKFGNITKNTNIAKFLNENLFQYGISIEENELIEKFTGEKLSVKALCETLK